MMAMTAMIAMIARRMSLAALSLFLWASVVAAQQVAVQIHAPVPDQPVF